MGLTQPKTFLYAFVTSGLALAIPILPLFWHRSGPPPEPAYSSSYLLFLVICAMLGPASALLVALRCRVRNSLAPAALLAFSTLLILGTVGMAELGLRMWGSDPFSEYAKWGHERSVLFGFEAKKNHAWKSTGAVYTTDSLGFRTNTQAPDWHAAPAAGPRDLRVFVLGGSSVFGLGLYDDETWAETLQRHLRAHFTDREVLVVNAGNNGHDSLQIMLRLYTRVLEHKPTHVIYYGAYNDARLHKSTIDSAKAVEDIVFSPTVAAYQSRKHPTANIYVRSAIAYQLQTSYARLQASLHPETIAWSAPLEAYAKDPQILVHNANRYVRNLRTIDGMCKQSKTKLILTTFLESFATDASEHEQIYTYNIMSRALAANAQAPLIDLEKVFRGQPDHPAYFHADHYHPNRKGADFIARFVAIGMIGIIEEQEARAGGE